MKLSVLIVMGLALAVIATGVVLAGENEPTAGKALRPFAEGFSPSESPSWAFGNAVGPWHETLAAKGARAPRRLRLVPPSPFSGAPLLGGNPWVLTNSPVLGTNVWVLGRRLPPYAVTPRPAAPMVAPPGVYLSEPFKLIVVVPGSHPDDRCLIGGDQPTEPMPTYEPSLRLVPFGK